MDLPEDHNSSQTLPEAQRNYITQPNKVSGWLIAFGVSLLLVAIIALVLGQRIGYHRGLSFAAEEAKKTAAGLEISAENIKSLKLKSDTLQSQLTTAQQERDISLANLSALRTDIQDLKVTNLQLEQGQQYLTASLAKKGGMNLQVIGAKIAPLPENAYEYRFDVGMVDPSNQPKNLIPKLTLLDEVNMVEVPLQPNSYSIHGIARIRGRFLMPKNFVPKQVKLELTAGNQKTEQVYDWQLGQPIDNMPYTLEETPEADKRPVSSTDSTPVASTANTQKPAATTAAK